MLHALDPDKDLVQVQDQLNIPQAEAEYVIQPDSVADVSARERWR
jgi:hypothetical protein